VISNGSVGAEGRGSQRFAVVGGGGTVQLPAEILARFPAGTLFEVGMEAEAIVLRPRDSADGSRDGEDHLG
jgi:putative ABC transport system ATP-binding protein